jgi:hypothetical protein
MTPEPTTPAPPSGLLARVLQVFVSPVRLMETLRHDPSSGGAIAVGIVLSMVAVAVLPPSLWEASLEKALAEGGMPADMGMNLGVMARVTWVTTVFGILLIWPITVYVSSAIYAGLFLFVFGYEGSWKQLRAITAYALLISAAASLLLVPFRFAAEDPSLILSVGRILPDVGDGFLGRFLNLLDLPGLWAAGIVGVGAAVMDGRRTVNHGVGVALGVSVALYLVIAWVSGFFGSFAP